MTNPNPETITTLAADLRAIVRDDIAERARTEHVRSIEEVISRSDAVDMDEAVIQMLLALGNANTMTESHYGSFNDAVQQKADESRTALISAIGLIVKAHPTATPPRELIAFYYPKLFEQTAGPETGEAERNRTDALSEKARHYIFELETPLTEAEGTLGIIRTVADFGTPANMEALHPLIVTLGEQLNEIRVAFRAASAASKGGAS